MIELFQGLGILIVYYILCASCALLLRRFVRIPREVFRKLLHFILLGSLILWTYVFRTWWIASLAALTFAAALYPLLSLAEKIFTFSDLFIERKAGEIKHSFITVFGMFAALNGICWGLLGKKWLVLACICAWGFGDAAAALVGKKYGKHYLEGKHIEGRKSVEGSLAMFSVSLISVFFVLLVNANIAWYDNLAISVLTAAVSSTVELYTRNGMDTITCPFAAAAVILPIMYFIGS
jgi:phytol kinase